MKITGKVVKGKGEGKGLGFPTANLKATQKFELADGVYLAEAHHQGKACRAIAVKGVVDDLEVWLKDCEENLYDQELAVEIGKKISEIVTFNTKEELINKIQKDLKIAKQIWETN